MKYFSNLRDKTLAWTVPGSGYDREKTVFIQLKEYSVMFVKTYTNVVTAYITMVSVYIQVM